MAAADRQNVLLTVESNTLTLSMIFVVPSARAAAARASSLASATTERECGRNDKKYAIRKEIESEQKKIGEIGEINIERTEKKKNPINTILKICM